MNIKTKTADSLTTKLIAVFFPLKPLKTKFSDNFIAQQITNFVSNLVEVTDKTIFYKIDKERFYTFDFKKEKFDDDFDVVDNETIVSVFSVEKEKNVDFSSNFNSDFAKHVNTIRIHRKKIKSTENKKSSYIFFTINSTKLLNNIEPLISKDSSNLGKTFFILSANNAKRNDLNPLEKSFSTEKICRMNYFTTIDLKNNLSHDFLKNFKKKLEFKIKT